MVAGSDNGDCNIGGKRGGSYMYLYVDRSEKTGHPGYRKLDVLYGKNAVAPVLWDKVSGDLNKTCGKTYIYLIARRAEAT